MTDNIPKIRIKEKLFNEILEGKNFIEKRFTTKRLNFWDRKLHNFDLIKKYNYFNDFINPICKFEFVCKENKNKILPAILLDITDITKTKNSKYDRTYKIKFKKGVLMNTDTITIKKSEIDVLKREIDNLKKENQKLKDELQIIETDAEKYSKMLSNMCNLPYIDFYNPENFCKLFECNVSECGYENFSVYSFVLVTDDYCVTNRIEYLLSLIQGIDNLADDKREITTKSIRKRFE